MKILLPVDGSSYSDAAIEAVGQRPWPPDSEIKVITVAEAPILGMEPWVTTASLMEEMEKAVKENAERVIEDALRKLNAFENRSLKISSSIVQGSPKQGIVEEAEAWNANLIVMGSRGRGAWNRLLLGSVSDSVVHHAKCSVEIVRNPYPRNGTK